MGRLTAVTSQGDDPRCCIREGHLSLIIRWGMGWGRALTDGPDTAPHVINGTEFSRSLCRSFPWNRARGQGLQVGKTEADKGLEETKEVLLPLEAAPSGAGPSDWGIPGPLESWNSVLVWNIPDPSPNSHAGSWRAGPLLGFLGHFCLKPMDLALWSSSRNNQVYGPEKTNSTPNT